MDEIVARLNIQDEKESKKLVKLANSVLKKMLSQGLDER